MSPAGFSFWGRGSHGYGTVVDTDDGTGGPKPDPASDTNGYPSASPPPSPSPSCLASILPSPISASAPAAGKLRTRETIIALTCVALVAMSYLALMSMPSGFYGSLFSSQVRGFFQHEDVAPAAAPLSEQPRREKTMAEVFEEAATPDRTVIITTLNAAWAEEGTMIDLFLESFAEGEGTQALLNHLVIVCLDQRAYNRCMSIHPHCIKIRTGGVDFSGEQALLSHDYIKMIWRRIKFLKTVLEMNYNFIFTDTDILWFRNPFPHLMHDKKAELQIACDRYNGKPWDVHNNPNAGFTYVRSTNATVKFYKYWYGERYRNPHWADQEVLNVIKLEDEFQKIGMNMRFLDTQHFGGFCSIRFTDMTNVVTMHATCCKGLEAKLADLRDILAQWKQYKQEHEKLAPESSLPVASVENAPLPAPKIPLFKVPDACPRSWQHVRKRKTSKEKHMH